MRRIRHRYSQTHGSRDEGGIVAVCTVPVPSVEYADCLAIFGRQAMEELDEAAFVVNLQEYVLALTIA